MLARVRGWFRGGDVDLTGEESRVRKKSLGVRSWVLGVSSGVRC